MVVAAVAAPKGDVGGDVGLWLVGAALAAGVSTCDGSAGVIAVARSLSQ
jgi:hypothetical protein